MRYMFCFLVGTMIFAPSIFGADISSDANTEVSTKFDKGVNSKRAKDHRNSVRGFNSKTLVKSHSADVGFDPIPIYLEYADTCVKEIAVASDFGLSAVIDDGVFDLNKKSYIDNSSSSAVALSSLDDVDVEGIKEFMACIIYESARMAQSNIILQRKIGQKKFTSRSIYNSASQTFNSVKKISDPFILGQMKRASMSLNKECRFLPNMGKDSIQCGSLSFSFVDNSIKQGGIFLSPSDKIYGVNAALRVSLSNNETDGDEIAVEDSKSRSSDTSLSGTISNTSSESAKSQQNVSPFLPK